ncbi:MAG: thiamine pyrophosphate-dependent enzyme, partial [Planctomycetota bacterium]
MRKRAARQLRSFAERTGIGVVNTFMGKGVIPRGDPHCLFTMGLQTRDHVTCLMEEADVVIAVGYDLVEYHPRFWNKGRRKQVIHIDFEPAEVDADYNPQVEIVADIADSLWTVNEALGEREPLFDASRHSAYRETMLAELAAYAEDAASGAIKPQKALWDARQALGPEDILLSDVGAHKMWIGRYYPCDEPNTCLISNGFCSMGFAFPGAMAAKLVHPDRRVLAICGDGGFLMNIQDLETAVRLGLNVVVLVWEDGGYGLIEWKQDTQFQRHSELAFGNPDWVKLAEAFGAWGARVER